MVVELKTAWTAGAGDLLSCPFWWICIPNATDEKVKLAREMLQVPVELPV